MNLINSAQNYIDAGLAVLPVRQDKNPFLSEGWKNGFPSTRFENVPAIGIICGAISGSLECLDIDNHLNDATQNLSDFLEIPEVKEIYEKYKPPIQKTQNGGYHILYKCIEMESSLKLAHKLDKDGKPQAIFETRGTNAYFLASPSQGYQVIRNDILKIATILPEERTTLLEYARSFNAYDPTFAGKGASSLVFNRTYNNSFRNDRVGDQYNADPSAIEEMKSLLVEAGWVELKDNKWMRPGKTKGPSASLGWVAPHIFYVFSSNASPFELNRSYSPFQVLALLKFNGDFRAASRFLMEKYHITYNNYNSNPMITKKFDIKDIEAKLLASVIDTSNKPPKPPCILEIKETIGNTSIYKRIFTLGNISAISGKAKSKKTFLLALFASAVLRNKSNEKLSCEMPTDKNLIMYFDTEMGLWDSVNTMSRIELLAGTKDNFKAFNFRDSDPDQRIELIKCALSKWGYQTAYCVIDGIADLAHGVNNEEEATRIVTFLLQQSTIYNCHICVAIHQNKNNDYATGWLGTAIMKKAEVIISVVKSTEDARITDVSCDYIRGTEDFETFSIKINDDGLPEITDYMEPQKKPLSFQTNKEYVDYTETKRSES